MMEPMTWIAVDSLARTMVADSLDLVGCPDRATEIRAMKQVRTRATAIAASKDLMAAAAYYAAVAAYRNKARDLRYVAPGQNRPLYQVIVDAALAANCAANDLSESAMSYVASAKKDYLSVATLIGVH